MQTINPYIVNKVKLDDPNIKTDEYTIKYSLIDETGVYIKDKQNTDIKDRSADFDSTINRYVASIEVAENSKGKYWRLTFQITKGNDYIVSNSAIQDVIFQKTSNVIQLVPVPYFKDYMVNGNLNPDTKDVIDNYPDDGIREWLSAATDELQNDTEVNFTLKTEENEVHDWNDDNFRLTWWAIYLFHYPVKEVQSYNLFYGEEPIMEIPKEKLTLDRKNGIVEYVPTSGDALLVIQDSSLAASTFSLFSRAGGAYRMPNTFRVSYSHGLDFLALTEGEQANIRTAISRRTMINALSRISPDLIRGAESAGIDGSSYSESNQGLSWLQAEMEKEKAWIRSFKRKQNTQFKAVVA